ncbi:MAG: SDR family NAD(P)-dependent oxidoreductase [Planctomycetaceae bacterium]
MLEVVAEKTGYPSEMLKPEMSLDHDLGIDSIRRVEILSAAGTPSRPAGGEAGTGGHLLHRLEDVIALLGQAVEDQGAAVEERKSASLARSGSRLTTTVPQLVPAPASNRRLAFAPGSIFAIVSDKSSLAEALRAELELLGYRAQQAGWTDSLSSADGKNLAGLILLSPGQGSNDEQLWQALDWVKHCGPALRASGKRQAALLATISRLDGGFGTHTSARLTDPLSGALAGLAKTVRHEWPEVSAKAVDLSDVDALNDRVVAELIDRLLSDGPAEIGYVTDGWRQVETAGQTLPEAGSPPVNPGDLLIVTGGARGVTAACALAVARAWKPRLLLLGRTPLTEEPAGLSEFNSPAEIKSALLRQGRPGTTPREIERDSRQILANREVRKTLQAIRAAGADVDYVACDIRDSADVQACLREAQQQFGPVRGVIHGAGVLEDRRIEDKTREQFENVFQTKVAGWQNLFAALDPDELRCVALFSSSTGRFGRTGQVDYAMANEALNKLAQQCQRQHPACRVRSFNWGPGDGGMVTEALKPLFAQEGIGLIPLETGAQLLVHELEQPGADRPVELVVLAELGTQEEDQGARDEVSSPQVQNRTSSTTSTGNSRLAADVLEVVSEKTGYPSEMLKPEMSLDHDLGIDSIKRVEILSAAQERRPDLPAVKPEQLGTLHRLQDVIEFLSQAAGDQASTGEAPQLLIRRCPLSLSP